MNYIKYIINILHLLSFTVTAMYKLYQHSCLWKTLLSFLVN